VIVQRMTWKVKRGCMEELVALAKSVRESSGWTGRILTDLVGRHDTVVTDHEFGSLAEMDEFWAEWRANADYPAFAEKWFAVTERGGTTDIWNLE